MKRAANAAIILTINSTISNQALPLGKRGGLPEDPVGRKIKIFQVFGNRCSSGVDVFSLGLVLFGLGWVGLDGLCSSFFMAFSLLYKSSCFKLLKQKVL